MQRKYTYPLLMMLAIAAIYVGEQYLEKREQQTLVNAGRTIKTDRLDFYLPSSSESTTVHHNYYSLDYNEEAEQASWVAYTLNKEQLNTIEVSRPYFDIDAAVSTGAADWRNYKNSGYDRGHLCAAGDRKFSTQAYNETFLTSNISPQLHDFNSGIWNRLENQVRDWVHNYNEITIISAGVLTDPIDKIGEEQVYVPSSFYKILIRKTNAGYTCLAFLIPHQATNKNLIEFVVSVDKIEAITGIDFFPKLEDNLENAIEKNTNLKAWSF